MREEKYEAKLNGLSIVDLENEIRFVYKKYLDRCLKGNVRYWENKISTCLSHRKHRLNKEFQFTPEHVAEIIRVNSVLGTATNELLNKTNEFAKKLRALKSTGEPYFQDYRLESSLRVDFYWPDFEPDEITEENLNQLDKVSMYEIFNEFPSYNELRSFNTYSDNNDMEIENNMDSINWDIEELGKPELANEIKYCYAAHHLFCHMFYAYQDIIHIKNFRVEVEIKLEKKISNQ